MNVSVVIASFDSPQTLRRCLEAVTGQGADEVIVADASAEDPSAWIRRDFPHVAIVRFDEERSVPQLRSAGLRLAQGDIVATTEGWMIPCSGWIEGLRTVHAARREGVAGCGIAFPAPGARPGYFAWAEFFSEYGLHAAPVTAGAASQLTGPSLSYKRAALQPCASLINEDAWDTWLLAQLSAGGEQFWLTDRYTLAYDHERALLATVRQRFHYGRWFAAERFAGRTGLSQFPRAAAFPLAAWLLLARLWGSLRGKGLRGRLLWTAPLVLMLYACWAAGEAAGMLAGAPANPHRNF